MSRPKIALSLLLLVVVVAGSLLYLLGPEPEGPGVAVAQAGQPAPPPARSAAVEAPARSDPPSGVDDAALRQWIAGGWAEASTGCGTDGGDFLSPDGRYGDYGREGSWRIENGRLIITITHEIEWGSDGGARPLPEPATSVMPIRRDGADRMTRTVNGRPVEMIRCPDARFEFSS